jgi:hypothetical protein
MPPASFKSESTEIPKDGSEYETKGKTPKRRTAIKVETTG